MILTKYSIYKPNEELTLGENLATAITFLQSLFILIPSTIQSLHEVF